MSNESTSGQAAAPRTTARSKVAADAWGQPIRTERQAELQAYLDRWQAETDHDDQKGPLDGVRLTGADVFWLAAWALAEQEGIGTEDKEIAEQAERLRNFNEGRITRQLALDRLRLSLERLHLEGAILGQVLAKEDILFGANLQGAILGGAHLDGAILVGAHLDWTVPHSLGRT